MQCRPQSILIVPPRWRGNRVLHYTVHKLNDCLHPMECIPEMQFLMRSKINLGLLLHIWSICEREEDFSQSEQILLKACFIEDPGSNPCRGKKKNFVRAGIFKKQHHWDAISQCLELQSDALPLCHAELFLILVVWIINHIFFWEKVEVSLGF